MKDYNETLSDDDASVNPLIDKSSIAKMEMIYLNDYLSYNRKESNQYIIDHEKHQVSTATKLSFQILTSISYKTKPHKSPEQHKHSRSLLLECKYREYQSPRSVSGIIPTAKGRETPKQKIETGY